MSKSEIASDTRKIRGIYSLMCDGDGNVPVCWQLETQGGSWKCDAIEAYDELGPGDFMPWLRVIRNGAIVARVPAWGVEITYEEDPES